jgi:glycosyltransferase involved in cell wall biosynthesis
MRVCVIIPAYNESSTIAGIVKDIRSRNLDCLVVDDGSIDSSAHLARDSGATVLRNTSNMGKGASLIRGFDFALKNNYDAVITMDGDGQHRVDEIPKFINKCDSDNCHIVVGNRMSNVCKMPCIRVLTNRFMSWLISRVAKQKIEDTQCGFRLLKKDVLEKIKLETNKFEIESEILIKGAKQGFKIGSIAIESVYVSESSHINPIKDTFRFIKFILKYIGDVPT